MMCTTLLLEVIGLDSAECPKYASQMRVSAWAIFSSEIPHGFHWMPTWRKRVGMAFLHHIPSSSHSLGSSFFLGLPPHLHLGSVCFGKASNFTRPCHTVQNVSENILSNWGLTKHAVHCLPFGGVLTAASCSLLSVLSMSEGPMCMISTPSSWGLIFAACAWNTDQVNRGV